MVKQKTPRPIIRDHSSQNDWKNSNFEIYFERSSVTAKEIPSDAMVTFQYDIQEYYILYLNMRIQKYYSQLLRRDIILKVH